MSLLTPDESPVDHYRRLRAAGQQLVGKMYDLAAVAQYDIVKAAKKLTLPVQEETLVFNSETDSNALADFYLHEMRYGGKRIVDLLAESNADLTSDEQEVLTADRRARCSLFAVRFVEVAARRIQLQDLLETARPEAALTDINLSQCSALQKGDLLFTRLVECPGVTMSGGVFFAFRAIHRVSLLNAYSARMRTVKKEERSQRRYIFFYQRYREFGLDQAYEELP